MNKYLDMILPYFPKASIYKENEIIIEPKNNIYFRIDNIESNVEFKCKMLEWCSRPCVKGVTPYWQRYMLRGVNSFFGNSWSNDDMVLIYTKLGNGVNRPLCIDFINSNFVLEMLKKKRLTN